ncbi:MAG: glutamine-hydrolyzing carbamoyl-phosphate synthase small subunit, partial [Bacteroidota bacterium]
SYKGQLLLATNVHIGNYGITEDESESNSIKIAGLICRNFSQHHSRKQADASLTDYFIEQNMVAICEIDTRALVRHIRNKGAMNGIISSETLDVDALKKALSSVPSMEGLELSSTVSTKEPYFFGNPDAKFKVAVLDEGVKTNTLRCLSDRNCYVKVFPYNTSFEEMNAWEPDGFLVSNGPGDPAVMPGVVQIVKDIIAHDKPVFGICLGHQLIAEACGISTFKMFNGHRGINHPVKNMVTGHSEVTSQNHGFSIGLKDADKSDVVEITHVNLNDHSVEGIRVKNKKAFSVQYHPESAPGPDDSRYLFDEFVGLLKVGKMVDVEM